MHNSDTTSAGYTIVELLIVVIITGILTILVTTNVVKSQAVARDKERVGDIASLARSLEEWYKMSGQGRYPSETELVDNVTWRSANLKGLDPNALIAPKASGTNSLIKALNNSTAVDPLPTPYTYIYQARTAANTKCSTSGDQCTSFNLYYYEESTGSIKRVGSLQQ